MVSPGNSSMVPLNQELRRPLGQTGLFIFLKHQVKEEGSELVGGLVLIIKIKLVSGNKRGQKPRGFSGCL